MNSDTKIQVSVGCTGYLVEEVERLRRENQLLAVENQVMNRFFDLVERLGPKPEESYSQDRLYQAKKEIQAAEHAAASMDVV